MYIKKDTIIPYMIVIITIALKLSSLLVFCMLYANKKPSHKSDTHAFLHHQKQVPITYKILGESIV